MNHGELLRLCGLTLPYGRVSELTHTFRPGVHLVVGPNGIGKTSLLRAISGALPATKGSIFLDDVPLGRFKDQVVLAPGMPPALPWLRAGLLIEFVVSLYPSSRRHADYQARVLEHLRLSDAMDAPMGALSAGMAKKVLLAATLIAAPAIMLFDEPINELDTASCEALLSLLAEYRNERILLIATHHQTPFHEIVSGTLALDGANMLPGQ